MKMPIFKLRTRITLLVAMVLVLVLVVTGVLVTWKIEQQARDAMAEKAVLLSRLTAESEVVVEGLAGRRPPGAVQCYAERICDKAKVDYVVVLDMNHIRLSHPRQSRIGLPFVGGDDADAYRGIAYTSKAEGTLGTALRAFTPVLDPGTGRQIGAVAVGILMKGMDQALASVRKRILFGVLVGFVGGIIGAVLIADHTRKILMGMEPLDISTMLQQRNAILQSVREGVVAVDRDMAITIVNEEASRLFKLAGIQGNLIGLKVDATPAATYLKSVLETGRPVFDRELVIRDLHLVSSVVPVMAGPRITGVVATFRDKTEVIQLAEQMSGVRIYAEALRAQTHEFINKLHVILGLVRLGEFERLATFLAGLTGNLQDDVGHVIPRIKDPVIAGFLLARFSAAREQNITMRLSETSQMPNCLSDSATHDIVTILGNLLENAVEAMGDSLCREIHVHLQHDQECLVITVEDTGRGIRPEHLDWLFERGFTTKEGDRGHGLHLVAQRLAELRGRIEVSRRAGGGTIFSASFSFPDTLPV